MNFSLSSKVIVSIKVDCFVIGLLEKGIWLVFIIQVDEVLDGLIKIFQKNGDISGKNVIICIILLVNQLWSWIFVVGIGNDIECIQVIYCKVLIVMVGVLKDGLFKFVFIILSDSVVIGIDVVSFEEVCLNLIGCILEEQLYIFMEYKSEKLVDCKFNKLVVIVFGGGKVLKEVFNFGFVIGCGMNFICDLGNILFNICYLEYLVQ